MPYTISIPIGPDGPGMEFYKYQAKLIISQTDGQYYVELAEVETLEFEYDTDKDIGVFKSKNETDSVWKIK